MNAILTKLAVLPQCRRGGRPRMRSRLPHIQLDQLPALEIIEELVERCQGLPYVNSRQSRMGSPGSLALSLPDQFAAGPPGAFIDDHEFCHLHPLPAGSLHLTLPKILREEVLRLGWGELHPIAEAGILTALVTVYAPRTLDELPAVLSLVGQSCQFTLGELEALCGDERPSVEDR